MFQLNQFDVSAFSRKRVAESQGKLEASLPLGLYLAPRDEAVFWLTAASEIEHALMVQYLFAAYSLNPEGAGDHKPIINNIKNELLQIAREEMGHLLTVQNLLRLIGAPLNLRRQHSPFASEIYPFRFKLEPLSLKSLAKYVVAESPADSSKTALTGSDLALFENQIMELATCSNDGEEVRHVGPLFNRLDTVLSELKERDFRLDRAGYQARWSDWGYEARNDVTKTRGVLIDHFEQTTPTELRVAARKAIKDIGTQGEHGDGDAIEESHFERFFLSYKKFSDLNPEDRERSVWPVELNPNTTSAATNTSLSGSTVDVVLEGYFATGRITCPRCLGWAQLFNIRYRLLLGYLLHTLHLDAPLFEDAEDDSQGDRTAKGLLQYWTFCEMRRIKKISEKVVQIPKDPGGIRHGGPPFELPYTLQLPSVESDRWRTHADVLEAGRKTAEALIRGRDSNDPFLAYLLQDDEQTGKIADAMSLRGTLPKDANLKGFKKIATFLEEAVRGFSIRVHKNFWQNKTAGEFIRYPSPEGGTGIVSPGDPIGSPLIQALERSDRRMPRYRPLIPETRLDFLKRWIKDLPQQGNLPPEPGIGGEPDPLPEPSSPDATPIPDKPPAADQPQTGDGLMIRFQEVIDILDDAIGGPDQTIGAHGAFWRGKSRDDFVQEKVFGTVQLIEIGNGAQSNLVKALKGEAPFDGSSFRRMPGGREPVAAEKIAIIEKWIDDEAPE